MDENIGSFWGDFGLFLGRSGVIFGSLWDHVGIILASFWGRVGVVLRSFGALFGPFYGDRKLIAKLSKMMQDKAKIC